MRARGVSPDTFGTTRLRAVVTEDAEDGLIPGREYGLSALERAQADAHLAPSGPAGAGPRACG